MGEQRKFHLHDFRSRDLGPDVGKPALKLRSLENAYTPFELSSGWMVSGSRATGTGWQERAEAEAATDTGEGQRHQDLGRSQTGIREEGQKRKNLEFILQ